MRTDGNDEANKSLFAILRTRLKSKHFACDYEPTTSPTPNGKWQYRYLHAFLVSPSYPHAQPIVTSQISLTQQHQITAQIMNFVSCNKTNTLLLYYYITKRKDKVRPERGHEGLDGGEWLMPGRFTPGKKPCTHCIRGSVKPRASLDGCRKFRPHQDSIPGPSSPQQVAIPTELFRTTYCYYYYHYY